MSFPCRHKAQRGLEDCLKSHRLSQVKPSKRPYPLPLGAFFLSGTLKTGAVGGGGEFCSAKETEETLLHLPLSCLGLEPVLEMAGLACTKEQSRGFLWPPPRGERDLCSWTQPSAFLNGSQEHPAVSLPALSLRVGISVAVLRSRVSESLSSQTPFFLPCYGCSRCGSVLVSHPFSGCGLCLFLSYSCHREGEQVTAHAQSCLCSCL